MARRSRNLASGWTGTAAVLTVDLTNQSVVYNPSGDGGRELREDLPLHARW
jgi:hypothetical protein